MNRELFGVFGPRTTFEEYAPAERFDRIVEGESITIGVRDDALPLPDRADAHRGAMGVATTLGELYTPARTGETARWLLERYAATGQEVFAELNGSYLAAVEHDGEAVVATDVLRTRECFYTDAPGTRVFGTDPTRVASAVPAPRPDIEGILQFLYLGVVLGERTVLERLRRIPTDALLTRTSVEPLSRLVYDPREFDYASELAARLDRAVRRRVTDRERTGLLLSGGYDSRVILALHPRVDDCYTVGTEETDEVQVARQLADQYGTAHTRLAPGERYLVPTAREINYSQGLRETLHIHHSGHEETMTVGEMFHGMLFDTLFRNPFVPNASIEVAGVTVPFPWLDRDPGRVTALEDALGCVAPGIDLVAECDAVAAADRREFLRETFERELARCYERCDGQHNACAQLGMRARPSMPFRRHLIDQFRERFVAADPELVEWHLRTPPEHRTNRTFLRALRQLDDGLLAHRPPNRPYDSFHLNEIEGFVRRKTPFLEAFDSPLPDRARLYDRYDLDRKLLADVPELHDAPVQFKLRLNDVRSWLDRATRDGSAATADELHAVLRG